MVQLNNLDNVKQSKALLNTLLGVFPLQEFLVNTKEPSCPLSSWYHYPQ